MLSPQLITPPNEIEASAASLDEIKGLCGVTENTNDILLWSLGIAATQYLDGKDGILMGRCLVTQTWREDFDTFHCEGFWGNSERDTLSGVLRLRLFPVASITSIKYSDSDGIEQTLASNQYRLLSDALGAYIAPVVGATFVGWPSVFSQSDAVRVTYVVGTAQANVPQPIRTAICMMVKNSFSMTSSSATTAQRDLALTSETVDGVGSLTWRNGVGGFSSGMELVKATDYTVDALLAPYRRIYL